MKTWRLRMNTNRIKNSRVALGGLSFRYLALFIGFATLCWLSSAAAASRPHPVPELSPMTEQSFGFPQSAVQELTMGQGWGAEHPRMLADVNGDKRQDVVGFGDAGVWLATSQQGTFSPAFVLADFGYQSGWRVAKHVRTTGDINGDRLEDIVGFGEAGVYRALSTASGFGPATYVSADFGYNQGWRVDRHVRLLADVNGDGRKDIVAFGDTGVWLALATSSGYFTAPMFVVAEFGFNQGWTPTHHPRMTADVNGDGRQDIVGFANEGVWIALSTGNGFSPAQDVLPEFGYLAGGWFVDRHPRLLADINGDGKHDIVGFGDAGVWTALSTGSGFEAAQFVLADFGYNQGWRVGKHPRFVADLNGDGYQDIVGFGKKSVYRALGGPAGFGSVRGVLRDLAAERFPFNLDDVDQLAPRFVGDVDGDGKQDLVAFDATEIKVARSSDLAPPPPVPLNTRSTGETTSAFTFAGNIGVDLAILPEVQPAHKPPCSDRLHGKVRAPATGSAPEVYIDEDRCTLTLDRSDVITKRLIFEGASASGVTVEGNGATIDGGPGRFNAGRDMIEVRSMPDGASFRRPEGVTIRNCKITGSMRIYGMGKNGEATAVRDSSRQDAGHIARLRNAAPTRIILDSLTITGTGRTPLYLAPGVTYVTVTNSEFKGTATRTAIYLDAESAYNTIKNNNIYVDIFDEWPGGINRIGPQVSIDTSSYNKILNNYFAGLTGGGIFTFRNCGEGGTVRHGSPKYNHIINNVFYYNKSDGDTPAVLLGSRGQWYRDFPWWTHCDDDEGYPWGSSVSNEDFSKYNVVMQNQVFKFEPGKMLKQGDDSSNGPNYINYNQTVSAKIERGAGCYINNGSKDFIVDRESITLFRNSNGDLVCTGYRYTCNDGVLSQSSDSTCQVSYMDFECQASGNNAGCQKTVVVPAGKKIVGAKAACNLEYGTVAATDLNGVFANFVKVLRASDNVSQGSCTLGSTSIRSGEAAVRGINGLTSLSFGCRENDSNGGDCHIKGRLYYR